MLQLPGPALLHEQVETDNAIVDFRDKCRVQFNFGAREADLRLPTLEILRRVGPVAFRLERESR